MPRPRSAKTAGWAWLVYAVFVVYGSLVPFDFRPIPLDQAWTAFKHAPFLVLGVESRADWVANGVLYVPMGALGALALGAGGRLGLAAATSLAVACALAFAVEFAQLHFPPRTVSQNDLVAEVLGSLVGVIGAARLGPWLRRWWLAWQSDTAPVARLALQAYLLGYLLFCFFPFDLLVSRQEFASKLASGNWGWLFAQPEGGINGWFRVTLFWLVELVLAVPIGLALGTPSNRTLALYRGLAAGVALGLAIEIGQLFIASGVSQGASVLSRAAGAGLGAWFRTGGAMRGPASLRAALNRHYRWLAPAYLALLSMAAGWGAHPWAGWGHALESWDALRLLPFYYHYFTTEAAALTSLGSVAAMYAPLAVLAWARSTSPGGAATLAVAIAFVIESGKLFLAGTHPDPTNLLLAGSSVWLLLKAHRAWEHQRNRPIPAVAEGQGTTSRTSLAVEAEPKAAAGADIMAAQLALAKQQTTRRPPEQSNPTEVPPGGRLRALWTPKDAPAGIVLLLTLALASGWPAYPWLVMGVVGAAATITWRWPAAPLFIVPMMMPVLDLAPWSGRFFLDEFDLLCMACLAVGLTRVRPALFGPGRHGVHALAWAAFGASLLISAFKGMDGAWAIDMNSFSHYYSPFNGLRILKGAVWAWLFIALYRSLVGETPARARLFHAGLAVGLFVTILAVLWERLAFVGLFDFVTDYRVTGPFSVMNKGGAYIECFLAVGSAFAMVEMATARRRMLFLSSSVLLLLSTYATLVTYSRNGYAAVACAMGVALAAAWLVRREASTSSRLAVVVIGALALTAGLVLGSGFARERLGTVAPDFNVRWAHWQAALDLRDDRLATALFGVGLGRYPETHFWHSRTEPRAASFRLEPGNGNAFLRLAPGTTVYVEQIVTPPPGQELELTVNIRSAGAAPQVGFTLCRKSLLTSMDCEQVEVKGIKAPGLWQTQYATIPPLPPPGNAFAAFVPVKLSVLTPVKGAVVDIDNVSLRPTGSSDYLARNGSFQKGLDHWFFATDIDPPWHIHSLPVAVLFDQGWLGVASAIALLGVALAGGIRAMRGRRIAGMAAFAGLSAFMVSGTLNTLIDEPRFLWLFLTLVWLCAWHGREARVDRPNGVAQEK